MQRLLTASIAFLIAFTGVAQTSSQRASVQLSATVQSSPPAITLAWTTLASTTSITIYRKLRSATSWGAVLATPAAAALSYTDNTVVVGTAYEYKVVRVANGTTGTGYIASGIDVPIPDYRGKLVLLVDNTIAGSLTAELNQLQYDLRADGWSVVRSDVSPAASVTSIRNTVIGHYNADPTNVKAVYIVGHVPVPYSGNINPDGHSEHLGAWPTDGYYGELNGTWTDNSVNNNGSARPANRNTPGDGKFDQSNFPNDVELQVGRVDLSDLPAFATNATELTRAYLNRAHDYKIKGWSPQVRGLMFDNLQWVSNPLAASGWRAMAPLVGPSNITNANQNGTDYYLLVNSQSYLWTYSSGGGLQATDAGILTYNGADGVGTTQSFATTTPGAVFNMSFGSYFGDWDNRNNYLRAPLAVGQTLTNCWAAIPAWYFHHMGLGDNIGYSTLVSMNNSSLYTPLTDGWQGSIGRTHLGLMGDPALRMKMIAPPTNLSITSNSGIASFAWTASTESGLAGYHLYIFDAATGAITRLTNSPVSGTTYLNAAIPFVAGRDYMVRAVKLETNTSGSYLNLSLGAIGTSAGAVTNDCLGVPGGSALPGTACNDNNACPTGDVWNASCQCAGTPSGDTDGDGICNAQDNCPNIAGQIGSACNDGNACTTNDVINASCQCVGTPSGDTDGDGIRNCAGQLPQHRGPDRQRVQRRQRLHNE
ncbi:MAG: thrombospondin type 3 repeat-containing protein [Flavobacteriales bacterium]|nr:thrombospondin type 3 repeat-containing protein [Flavobacteriales bacterium]